MSALAVALAWAAPVVAAPTAEERQAARAHYDKAVNHFNASEHTAAADEFLLVYKTAPQPALLYNVAQAYRLGNDAPRAIEYYQAFLRAAPEARQRPEVERRMRELTSKTPVVVATPPPDMSAPPVKLPAAGSDRLQAVAELIKSNRAGFRACFDHWSQGPPGVGGRVTLTMYLDPDGNVGQTDADAKGFAAPEVERCIEEQARMLRYPKSSRSSTSASPS